MKNYFIGKRGELTTTQIILLVVLIVSFAVLIYFYTQLQLGGTSEKQICHNSIVLKNKAGGLGGAIDCKTTYMCISGGGECASSRQKISVNAEDNSEIFKQMAVLMSDCWWMFGEGSIDYSNWDTFDKNHCAICSKIKFDLSIQERYPEGVDFEQFYNYLGLENLLGKEEKYLTYLYGVDSVDNLSEMYKTGKINFSQEYSIITGINTEERSIPVLVKTLDEVHEQSLCGVFDITKN
jgi:hypothetical protein